MLADDRPFFIHSEIEACRLAGNGPRVAQFLRKRLRRRQYERRPD